MNLSATPFDADYYLPYYLLFVGVFVGLGGGMLDPFGVCSTILGFLLNELFLLFIDGGLSDGVGFFIGNTFITPGHVINEQPQTLMIYHSN